MSSKHSSMSKKRQADRANKSEFTSLRGRASRTKAKAQTASKSFHESVNDVRENVEAENPTIAKRSAKYQQF